MIQPASSSPISAAQSRGVKVTAFLDASEPVVEPFGAKRVDCLEKAKLDAGPDLDATAQVFRSGTTPREKMISGLKKIGLEVAMPVIGGVVGGPIGFAVGLAMSAGYFVFGAGRQGLGEVMSAHYQRQQLPDGDWKGMRRYEIAADNGPGYDSQAVASTEARFHPKASDLTDLLCSSMDPYRTNVVYVLGHGLGYRQSASMPVTDLRDSLSEASKKTGAQADVLVMESCLMANMEAMNELQGAAQVAVVSEESLQVDALPVREMMADAARGGGTPQEIARRMISIASKERSIDTLSAIDLTKMPALMQSLDRLGDRLASEIAGGHGPQIKAAVQQAMKYPQGRLSFMERAMTKLSDLGAFLDALPTVGLGDDTAQAAIDARNAMESVVIAEKRGDGYEGASGLSFQSGTKGLAGLLDKAPEMDHYADLALPAGWRAFIGALDGVK